MLFVNNDLMQRLTGCVAFLGDSGALLVAEMRLQECNDTDGVHDVVFAAFGVDEQHLMTQAEWDATFNTQNLIHPKFVK